MLPHVLRNMSYPHCSVPHCGGVNKREIPDVVWKAHDEGAITPVQQVSLPFVVAQLVCPMQRRPSFQFQHPFNQGRIEQPVTRG